MAVIGFQLLRLCLTAIFGFMNFLHRAFTAHVGFIAHERLIGQLTHAIMQLNCCT